MADNDIIISIIIATYNAEKQLPGCLRSITAQSFKGIEIVVIDGGSTDNTLSILKNYTGSFPLNWVSEPDKGIYDALNKGTRLAKGKWLHFLGADDRLLPGFSEMAAQVKEENAVYYGISKEYYTGQRPNYNVLTGHFSKYRLAQECMNHQAIVYPALVFRKYSYNLRYKVFADYDVNIRVWGDRQFKKCYYPIPVVSYNMNGFSSATRDELFKQDKPGIIKEGMGWIIYLRFLYKRYKKRKAGVLDF
ncbi:glycosyltransferase family 2 protein [Chitinophaga sp. HK235]|uniref:glycosyltransferase family 2 protein n=1 Tax=Chitinophaga sp. HK235 TaxID=2952571 RepID=UPI001BACF783|nr:glycosyltransferase family 2 protein [Chitinophaga sp. HK235]